jgi:starch phosphorylase
MLDEYASQLYVPLRMRAAELADDGHARARRLARWRRRITEAWPQVRIVEVAADDSATAVGTRRRLRSEVDLGSLTPDDVRVEVVHGAVDADGQIVAPDMEPMQCTGDSDPTTRYETSFLCDTSGEYGFTVRVVPMHDDLISPADTGKAVWSDADHVRYRHLPDG